MNYSCSLNITIPAALYDTACAISRALDPDTGGANEWGPRTILVDDVETTPETYSTHFLCTAEFYDQAMMLLADPAMMHTAVCADYQARWPDLVPPTLSECEAFCAGAVVPTVEIGATNEY